MFQFIRIELFSSTISLGFVYLKTADLKFSTLFSRHQKVLIMHHSWFNASNLHNIFQFLYINEVFQICQNVRYQYPCNFNVSTFINIIYTSLSPFPSYPAVFILEVCSSEYSSQFRVSIITVSERSLFLLLQKGL